MSSSTTASRGRRRRSSTGEATGHLAEAEALVADIEGQIQEVADAHPEWEGLEAAIGYVLTRDRDRRLRQR